ncbi:MAG: dihydropteroate synthase [Candidatus Omnitrophica bacterium]|nr:dihydropteroate synthase [Candidatus Omnitrophota bacterium]
MAIRVLNITGEKELFRLFTKMKVDPYGIRIMAPKAESFLIRIDKISCIAANILKQEMLSCGGDAALPRQALTGKTRKTECVLISTRSQFNRLKEKLILQQFGLNRLAGEISQVLENYCRESNRTRVMGILNLTPDSFSGDGLYGKDISEIAELAADMVRDGADILDLGGESSRPGAKAVSLKVELNRTIPVIKKISRIVSPFHAEKSGLRFGHGRDHRISR